jgi:long-subunit acyl-CoA synthetase (AMP-forming)
MFEDIQKNSNMKKLERLDLKIRNAFQIRLMKIMLGKEEPSQEEQYKWAEKYHKIVSDMIDDPVNTEIRYLMSQGAQFPERYHEAARSVIAKLNQEEFSKAA